MKPAAFIIDCRSLIRWSRNCYCASRRYRLDRVATRNSLSFQEPLRRAEHARRSDGDGRDGKTRHEAQSPPLRGSIWPPALQARSRGKDTPRTTSSEVWRNVTMIRLVFVDLCGVQCQSVHSRLITIPKFSKPGSRSDHSPVLPDSACNPCRRSFDRYPNNRRLQRLKTDIAKIK